MYEFVAPAQWMRFKAETWPVFCLKDQPVELTGKPVVHLVISSDA